MMNAALRKRDVKAQERDHVDDADHEAVDECNDDEDDDRDDPGSPSGLADVPEDRAEVERLTEAALVGEAHRGEQGDERHDDRDDRRKQESSDEAEHCSACCCRVAAGCLARQETDCAESAEEQEDNDRREHVDQRDEVQLPPVDKEPDPIVDLGSGLLSREHPHGVAAEEWNQGERECLYE